jgi:transposase
VRERVVAGTEAGASRRQTAQRFGIGIASANRWRDRFRRAGRIEPQPMGGDHRSQVVEEHAERIAALCEARPESFRWELRDALAERGATTSTRGLSRFFRRHASTRKRTAFAKLKALLRAAAARTVTDLWAVSCDACRAFTPAACRKDLTAAGYDAYDPT